jgi:tetratricopeptide (TPR) repeat protein
MPALQLTPCLYRLLIVATLLLFSCDVREPVEPPGAHECVAIAESFVASIERGDPSYFDQKFDRAALVARATHDMKIDREFRKSYIAGMDSLVKIVHRVIDVVREGGRYTLLQFHMVNKEPRILIRLLTADGRLNYHDLVFVRNPRTQQVVIGDIYIYLTGELLSASVKRNIMRATGRMVLGMEVKKEDKEYLEYLRTVSEMERLAGLGEHQKAVDLYRKLSSTHQHEKMALVLYATAAYMIDQDEYLRAIDLYAKEFPSDPSTPMFLIDKYVLLKRYDDCIAQLKKLDSLVDGDAYLSYMRGLIYQLKEDLPNARNCFKRAIAEEPFLEDPYLPMIDLLVRQGNFKDAVIYVNGLTNRFDKSFDDVRQLLEYKAEEQPLYTRLLQSEEFGKLTKQIEKKMAERE